MLRRAYLPAIFFCLLLCRTLYAGNAAEELGRYSRDMAEAGRRLLLVIIPPAQESDMPFYHELLGDLDRENVEVVDIYPELCELHASGIKVRCITDTHPAPAALKAAAKKTAARLAAGNKANERIFSLGSREEITVSGNLAADVNEKEILEFVPVQGETVAAASAVAVIGDSNALIYHDGTDLPVKNAGFADYLAYYLNEPVALTGMRGASADPIRGEIYRQWVQNPAGRISATETFVFILDTEQFKDGINRWRAIPAPGNMTE